MATKQQKEIQRAKDLAIVRTRLECAAQMLRLANEDVNSMRPYETEQYELSKQLEKLHAELEGLSRSALGGGACRRND